eukprot:scaffold2610_cov115-Isochrysis_galbana.AAC.13
MPCSRAAPGDICRCRRLARCARVAAGSPAGLFSAAAAGTAASGPALGPASSGAAVLSTAAAAPPGSSAHLCWLSVKRLWVNKLVLRSPSGTSSESDPDATPAAPPTAGRGERAAPRATTLSTAHG